MGTGEDIYCYGGPNEVNNNNSRFTHTQTGTADSSKPKCKLFCFLAFFRLSLRRRSDRKFLVPLGMLCSLSPDHADHHRLRGQSTQDLERPPAGRHLQHDRRGVLRPPRGEVRWGWGGGE